MKHFTYLFAVALLACDSAGATDTSPATSGLDATHEDTGGQRDDTMPIEDIEVADTTPVGDTDAGSDAMGVPDSAAQDATNLEGHWQSRSDLPTARRYPAAVVLSERIWVLGGFNSGPLDTVEVYDPAEDSWRAMPSMRERRAGPAAVVGLDGNVYVFGGQYNGQFGGGEIAAGVSAKAEMFDVAANAWVALPDLPSGRFSAKAAVLANGDIMIIGGESVAVWPSETLLYRPSTRAYSEGPSLVKPRANFGAAVLGDGRIYVAGGYANGHELDVTEIYDPADRSFSTAKALPGAYDGMAAVDTLAGVVMVIGGNGDQYGPQTGVLWYRLAERTWGDGPPLPTHRAEAAAVRTRDGLIWVVGGAERNGGVRFPSKRLDVFAP